MFRPALKANETACAGTLMRPVRPQDVADATNADGAVTAEHPAHPDPALVTSMATPHHTVPGT